MLTEGFQPLATFLVRPLAPVSARAGRWLADNLTQIFRHLDEWKLYKRHIFNMVSLLIQVSTIIRRVNYSPDQQMFESIHQHQHRHRLRRLHYVIKLSVRRCWHLSLADISCPDSMNWRSTVSAPLKCGRQHAVSPGSTHGS